MNEVLESIAHPVCSSAGRKTAGMSLGRLIENHGSIQERARESVQYRRTTGGNLGDDQRLLTRRKNLLCDYLKKVTH